MKKLTDPIAQLMQEHDDALHHLKVLKRAVHAFTEDGFSAKYHKEIKTSLKYIEEEVGVHNLKEEEALFPVLERYVEGPTRIMREDHRKLRRDFRKLDRAIKRLEKHRDSFSAIKECRKVTEEVVQLFVNHIHKENYILFPLVQRFLRKDELREIARKML